MNIAGLNSLQKQNVAQRNVLEGEQIDFYIERCIESLKAFSSAPDAYQHFDHEKLSATLALFLTANHHGLHKTLELDNESGFPVRGEFQKLEVGKNLSERRLQSIRPEEKIRQDTKARILEFNADTAESLEGDFASYLQREINALAVLDYNTKLNSFRFPPLINVSKKCIDEYEGVYTIETVVEGYDSSNNIFFRYLITFNYNPKEEGIILQKVLNKHWVQVEGGSVQFSDGLENFVRNLVGQSADIVYEGLGCFKQISPESVSRALSCLAYLPFIDGTKRFSSLDPNYQRIAALASEENPVVSIPLEEALVDNSGRSDSGYRLRKSPLYACTKECEEKLKEVVREGVFVI